MHNDYITSFPFHNLLSSDIGFASYDFDLIDNPHDTDCTEDERGLLYSAFAGNIFAQDLLWREVGLRLGKLRWQRRMEFLGVDAELIAVLKGVFDQAEQRRQHKLNR